MTPLLHKIMSDQCRPAHQRQLRWRFSETSSGLHELLKLLDGIQSFECSAVERLAWHLAVKLVDDGQVSKRTAFLPAARTWIEWLNGPEDPGISGMRQAFLLIDDERQNRTARCVSFIGAGDFIEVVDTDARLALKDDASVSSLVTSLSVDSPFFTEDIEDDLGPPERSFRERADARKRRWAGEIYAFLGMINAPRVFQRTIHSPHLGLQRRLLAAKSLVGKYPLGAWTEILLKIPAPASIGGSLDQGFMTGERALHWCRAHLRYRLGQWEIVTDHWRGNPAMGIKRSRYRVEAAHNNHTDGGGK